MNFIVTIRKSFSFMALISGKHLRYCFFTCVSIAPVQLSAQALTSAEITDICGGTQSWSADGENAEIRFRGGQLSVNEAQGSLEVREGGVLIAKIEDFAFGDYVNCAERLGRIGRQRDQSEISRQIQGFLSANDLPVPGSKQSRVELTDRYALEQQSYGASVSYNVLSGQFDLLRHTSDNGFIMRSAYFSGDFLKGVSKSVFCEEHYFLCERHYEDWIKFFDHTLRTGRDDSRRVAVAFGKNDAPPIMGTTQNRTYYLAPWRITVDHTYPDVAGEYRTWASLLVARD